MSKVNRNQIKKLILSEMRMLGMADMVPMMDPAPKRGCDACGMSPCGCDEYQDDHDMHDMQPQGAEAHMQAKGNVSREDCCEAVMCLIECCSCPITKRALEKCCADIMSGKHDS